MQPLNLASILQLAGDGFTRLADDVFLVSDPVVIEEILVRKPGLFHKGRTAQRMVEILGRASLLLEGDAWRQRRRLVQPAFRREHIDAIQRTVVERTEAHIATWSGTFDLREPLLTLFMDLTVANLFKLDVTGRMQELVTAWRLLFAHMSNRFADQDMPPEVSAARDTIDEVLWSLIRERRAKGHDGSLLSMLIEARDEDGTGLSDQELRDEVMTLFVGGYETSATAMLFALGLLSRHPDVARRHLAEVTAQCGDRPVTAADLAGMPLNRHIIEETMRLFPPSWLFTRELVQDATIAGQAVAAGTQFLISPWAVHHDASIWPNPEGFDPDRFEVTPRKMTWIPFGGGPRKCLGSHYALIELQVILTTLVRKVRLELEPGVVIAPEARLGLWPREPLRMRVVNVTD